MTIDGGYAVWNEEEKKNKKRPLPLNRLLLKGSITSFSPFLFFHGPSLHVPSSLPLNVLKLMVV
jgi:hypothetical protein